MVKLMQQSRQKNHSLYLFKKKNNNIFVSFIVPMYNSSKSIKKCLNSIVKKNFFNYEIIVVDDHSKDKSLKIVKKFSKLYPNIIKIFQNKKNYGVSYSRNVGIKKSKGDYLVFIDSDDFIFKKNLLKVIDKVKTFKPEITIIENYFVKIGKKIINTKDIFAKNRKIKKKQPIEKYFLKNFMKKQCWSYIYKRKFLIENKFFFPKDVHIAEDQELVIKTFMKVKNFLFLNIPYYCNNADSGSLSHKMGYKVCTSYFNVIFELLRFLKKNKLNKNQKALVSMKIDEFASELLPRILILEKKLLQKIKTTYFKKSKLFNCLKNNNFIKSLIKKNFDLLNYTEKLILKIVLKFKKFEKQKIYIFSRNAYGIALANILINNGYKYSGFIDNSKFLQGKKIYNKKIISPQKFHFINKNDNKNIFVIIANQQIKVAKQIKNQLKNKPNYNLNFLSLIKKDN